MNKLIIFGDSFAYDSGEEYIWTRQIANHFGVNYINLAEAGSSIYHANIHLMQYITNDFYSESDMFIYLITSCRRSPWASPPISAAMTRYFAGYYTKGHPNYDYYKKHEDFYVRYMDLYRPDIEQYQQLNILAMLHALPNQKLVFTCWPLMQNLKDKQVKNLNIQFQNSLFSSTDTTVFVPIPLYPLSMKEMGRQTQLRVEKEGWSDRRTNHFSPVNHEILKEHGIASFNSMTDMFDESAYHSNIFNPDN